MVVRTLNYCTLYLLYDVVFNLSCHPQTTVAAIANCKLPVMACNLYIIHIIQGVPDVTHHADFHEDTYK